jgi:hypothetical protein
VEVIAGHLAEWGTPHVERAIYGSDDAVAIASILDAFCQDSISGALFHRSSIGSVSALELEDNRRVVVKAHQPDRSEARLAEVVRLQQYLALHQGWAPNVILGPSPLGNGFAVVEEYVDRAEAPDPHDPSIRRAMAHSLHAIVAALLPFAGASTLPPQLLSASHQTALWPVPHGRLFDFGATCRGAEWIDELATEARGRMTPAGRIVLGHGDWRAEHVRFDGARFVVAFDWDSLCRDHEPTLVGFTAHGFSADWSRETHRQAPTLEEARAFVDEYQLARGRVFDPDERIVCGAAFTYAVAYTSRCVHALGRDERETPGTFPHLLASAGRGLFSL